MSKKVIQCTRYDDTLNICECVDGWWLYDTTRGMNISMRAKTDQDCFFEALKYYQGRLKEKEEELKSLKGKVSQFVYQFVDEYEEYTTDPNITVTEINI